MTDQFKDITEWRYLREGGWPEYTIEDNLGRRVAIAFDEESAKMLCRCLNWGLKVHKLHTETDHES